MPASKERRPSVVLGNLEPIARVGMTRLMNEVGIDVVGDEPTADRLLTEVERLHPDAVVLDLDQDASRDLGQLVRSASPETKVVFWGRDENVMEVIDPGTTTARLVVAGAPDELLAELSSQQGTPAEE